MTTTHRHGALSRFFAFITITFGSSTSEPVDSLSSSGSGPLGLDLTTIFSAIRLGLIIVMGVGLLIALVMLVRGIFLNRLANDNRGLVDQSRSIIMTVAVALFIIGVATIVLQWFWVPDASAAQ